MGRKSQRMDISVSPGNNNNNSSIEKGPGKERSLEKECKLQRKIGLLEAVAITIGSIVGTGIFISPKGILAEVGSIGVSLIIWCLCGFIAVVGSFTYIELATMFKNCGSDYTYISEAFGPMLGFLNLWASTIVFAPVSNAIFAVVISNYITQQFFECSEVPQSAIRLLSAVMILFVTFVNCCDIRVNNRFVNTFMFMKLSALGIIIVGGIYAFSMGRTENFQDPWANSQLQIGNIVLAIFAGGFAFGGATTLTSMVEELREPNKNLPRAIFISLFLITVIYILANISYFSVLSPDQMLNSDAVAVTYVEKLVGPFGWVVSAFVALSALGCFSIHFMASSRHCLVGARQGHMPIVLSLLTTNNQTPATAVVFLGMLSLAFLYVSDVFVLIAFSSIVGGGFKLIVLIGFFYLRWKRPEIERPFKVSLFFPVTYFLISLALFVIPIYTKPVTSAIGVVITFSGLPVYYLFVKRKQLPICVERFSERLTKLIQKIFLAVKED